MKIHVDSLLIGSASSIRWASKVFLDSTASENHVPVNFISIHCFPLVENACLLNCCASPWLGLTIEADLAFRKSASSNGEWEQELEPRKQHLPTTSVPSLSFGMTAQGAPSDCLWWAVCFAIDKEGESPFWHFCPDAPDFSVWNCQIRNFGWIFGWITLKGLSVPKMEIVRKQRRLVANNHEMVMTKSFIFAMKCHPLTL